MASRPLTETLLRTLPPDSEVWDARCEHLLARRRKAAVHFNFVSRKGGKRQRVTLGKWPEVTLAEARAKADKLRVQLHHDRPLHAPEPADSINNLLDLFLADQKARGVRTTGQTQWVFDERLRPKLGRYRAADLRRLDVAAALEAIESSSVRYRALSLLRAAWRWGLKQGHVDHDPVTALPLPEPSPPRTRILSDDEIRLLLADWLPGGFDAPARNSFCAALTLQLLTACRRSEIAEARWREVYTDRLVLPAERTKNAQPHAVPLTPLARRVLDQLPGGSPFLFPAMRKQPKPGEKDRAGRSGRGVISGWSRAVELAQHRAGVDGWTPHDLRRTAASGMERLGVDINIIERALNHTRPVLQRTYLTSDPFPKIREALQVWSDHVERLTQIKKPPERVGMRLTLRKADGTKRNLALRKADGTKRNLTAA